MRVCVLSILNLRHMTAAGMYFDYFEQQGIPFDVIHMDKYGVEESVPGGRVFRFTNLVDRKLSKPRKLLVYAKFLGYAIPKLFQNKYDLVVVWGVETALLFGPLLMAKWPSRYILNIRDYPVVTFPGVMSALGSIISRARFTTLSSPAYRRFLPKRKYVVSHTFNRDTLQKAARRNDKRPQGLPIRLGFLGYVRFFDIDKKILAAFANDPRFVVQYFGHGSEVLQEFAEDHGIKNAEFEPGFDASDTWRLLDRIDVVNNLYGYGEPALDTAVSIKYFYSVHLRLPILVFRDTFMQEVSEGIGLAVSDDFTNLPDQLFEWYSELNFTDFAEVCDKKRDTLAEENQDFYGALEEALDEVQRGNKSASN